MGKIVNRQEIGEIMDVSQQTISDWLAKGMPVIDRGAAFNDAAYDTGAVVRWYVEWKIAGVKGESQKERLDRVTADLRELDLQKRRGELLELEAVVPAWKGLVNTTRRRLLAIASAPEIPEAVRPALATLLADALRDLADHDPVDLVETD